MDFGLILPSYRAGASAEGLEAAAATAERLEWHSIWTTDHLLPGPDAVAEYGHLYEAVSVLAYLGGRTERVRLGTSVIVVPMRNAVLLARELASIDVLTRGRLIAGVGVGWNAREFGNVGVPDRFHRRGAYLEEAIGLWRHLWSGSTQPWEGRFHRFAQVGFSPLPAQGAALPILVGGRSEGALSRAGRLGDGYHASSTSPAAIAVRVPLIRAAAEAAGRAMPPLSARVRVRFGPADDSGYQLAGTPEQMASEIGLFADQGVSMIAFDFLDTDPERNTALVERFEREVRPAYRELELATSRQG
jgi:probable F420-dependent oxidoreductase